MIVSVSRTVYSVTVMQWCGAGRRGGEELCGISVKSHVQTPLSFVISSGSSGPSFLTTLAVEQSERSEECAMLKLTRL